MSGQTVISVENLGKVYRLNHQAERQRYVALRDVLTNKLKRLFRPRRRPNGSRSQENFWALKNVNFEVKQGEVIGIIGRNGAGKSKLLKILSRITEPSKGRVRIKGRVASLLEVGTGFHPELTGRENIFLNGAILGMSRAEIGRKFDEIVAFAEVERFLDTPVKHYSSGMYVRLAFAVAAHLEPEILVVDEVLAVGDAQFQKRCLGKMEDVARSGRTVLFVSHNMNAVEELCNRAILLEAGSVEMESSDVRSVLKQYLFGNYSTKTSVWLNTGARKNDWFHMLRLSVSDGAREPLTMPVRNDSDMWVEIEGDALQPDQALAIGYAIYAEDGTLLYWSCQTDGPEEDWHVIEPGRILFRSRIQPRFLNEGTYRIEAFGCLHSRQWLYEPGVNAPHVHLQIAGGLSDSPIWMARRPGLLAPLIEWDVEQRRSAKAYLARSL